MLTFYLTLFPQVSMTPLQSSKPSGITGGGFSCWYFVTAGRGPCPRRNKQGGIDSFNTQKTLLLRLHVVGIGNKKVSSSDFRNGNCDFRIKPLVTPILVLHYREW